jgi:hypothetical protein
LHFKKHYDETPCKLEVNLAETEEQLFKITFDPFEKKWESIEALY